jgi:hypothetical protein
MKLKQYTVAGKVYTLVLKQNPDAFPAPAQADLLCPVCSKTHSYTQFDFRVRTLPYQLE